MKKFITRVFVELYHWQNDNWGESNLPALTSLLYLSILQLLNFGSLLLLFDNITSINLAGYFSTHLAIGMIVPAALLIMNYLIVRPINVTVDDTPLKGRRITWMYVLATIFFLAACLAWVAYNNEKG